MSGTSSLFKNAPPELLENTLFNAKDPTSLINIIPDRLVPILHRIRLQMPRTMFAPENEIRRQCQPDERDERVRLTFWDEYNNSTAVRKKMTLKNVFEQVMSADTWEHVYEPDDKKMLWVFSPPKSYANSMKYILHLGTQRLQEIMEMPIVNKKGELDHKAATLILKTFQLVDMRVKGAITQNININQKNLNLNADVTQEQLGQKIEDQVGMLSLEELERMDRKLDRMDKQLTVGLSAHDKQEVLDIKAELEPEKIPPRLPNLEKFPDDEVLEPLPRSPQV